MRKILLALMLFFCISVAKAQDGYVSVGSGLSMPGFQETPIVSSMVDVSLGFYVKRKVFLELNASYISLFITDQERMRPHAKGVNVLATTFVSIKAGYLFTLKKGLYLTAGGSIGWGFMNGSSYYGYDASYAHGGYCRSNMADFGVFCGLRVRLSRDWQVFVQPEFHYSLDSKVMDGGLTMRIPIGIAFVF